MLDAETGRVVKKLAVSPEQYPPTYWLGPLRFSNDGRTLSGLCQAAVHFEAANPAGEKRVRFSWDLDTGARTETVLAPGGHGEIRAAILSPDGRLAFIPTNEIPLIDTRRGLPAVQPRRVSA